MSEDTFKKKMSWVKKNGFQLSIATLMALLSYLGSYIFEGLNDIQDRMARLETNIEELRGREINNVWRTLYLFSDRLDETRINVGVMRELYEVQYLPGHDGGGDSSHAALNMENLAEMLQDIMKKDPEYDPYELEQFQRIQEQAPNMGQRK